MRATRHVFETPPVRASALRQHAGKTRPLQLQAFDAPGAPEPTSFVRSSRHNGR